jgi:hypothetical protein
MNITLGKPQANNRQAIILRYTVLPVQVVQRLQRAGLIDPCPIQFGHLYPF